MVSVKQVLCGNDLFYSVGVLWSDGVIAEFFLFPEPFRGWWGLARRAAPLSPELSSRDCERVMPTHLKGHADSGPWRGRVRRRV